MRLSMASLSCELRALFLTLRTSMQPLWGSKESKASLTLRMSFWERPRLRYRCIGKEESARGVEGELLLPIYRLQSMRGMSLNRWIVIMLKKIILQCIHVEYTSSILITYRQKDDNRMIDAQRVRLILFYCHCPMARFLPHFPVPLQLLLDTYSSGTPEAINVFLDKRVTRFVDPQPKPTYYEMILKNHPTHTVDNDVITTLKFQQKCEEMGVDEFYWRSVVETLRTLREEERGLMINYELEQLEIGESYYSLLTRIIQARDNCIRKLKSLLEEGLKQSIAKLSEVEKLSLLLVHIRMLTLVLVENIYDWNYSLGSLFEQSVREINFEFRGEPVLSRICEDTDFLRNTKLKKYLRFAKGFDPLLIRVTKRRKESQNGVLEEMDRFGDFFLDFNILERLREAETVVIRYHSKKGTQSQHKESSEAQVKEKPSSLPFIQQVSQSRNLHQENVIIDLPPQVIQFRKQQPISSFKRYSHFPQPLHNHSSSADTHNSLRPKIPTSDPKILSLNKIEDRRNRVLDKLRKLKCQLEQQHDSQMDAMYQKERLRHKSQPNQQSPESRRKELVYRLEKVLPIFSEREIPTIAKKRRVTEKLERIRFLKNVYRDSTQGDLDAQIKAIKNCVDPPLIKKRKTSKRKRSLALQVLYNCPPERSGEDNPSDRSFGRLISRRGYPY